VTVQATLVDQLQQGVFDRHVQQGFQFVGEVTRWRVIDQTLDRRQQGPLAGKPRAATAPEPVLVKSRNGFQGVKATPMRVAGERGQLSQLAKDGLIDLGAQGAFHFGHGEGLETFKKVPERLKGKANRVHNVRMPLAKTLASVFLTLYSPNAGNGYSSQQPCKHGSICSRFHSPVRSLPSRNVVITTLNYGLVFA